ncbi:MAG: entry exclusion lipoprotein TrbK [Pseudomonas sp.]|uniref:EexN family lipoprotein n=1 Tax=Pseudomonas sp. FEMGT703P TaxID=2080764 RepID=UPI000CB32F84|nr:EexN family lipoprotein [Pseudomonas sp. FEMGT703P]PJE43124.1 MAG: entry exclusion lipoprotein TrbK [Pseudomonas sp.] [Pseudomonas sp. FEMGT703P]
MRKYLVILCVLSLAACGEPDTQVAPRIPSVDELAADPDTLKKLRQQCKLDRDELGNQLCSRVAEATRKRFYGDGMVPYTPSDEPPRF